MKHTTHSKIEKTRQRIAAILAKANDSASSEAEALTLAKKAQDMMAEWGLTIEDVQDAKETDLAEKLDVTRLRHHRHPVDMYGLGAISRFCDVQALYVWKDFTTQNGWATGFFGYTPDIELAHFLRNTLIRASDTEWSKLLPSIHDLAGGKATRKQINKARRSFMIGFCQRVAERLDALKELRGESGAALVLVKSAKIEELFSKAHPDLEAFKATNTETYSDIRQSGRDAGDKANLHRPVNDDKGGVLAICQQ